MRFFFEKSEGTIPWTIASLGRESRCRFIVLEGWIGLEAGKKCATVGVEGDDESGEREGEEGFRFSDIVAFKDVLNYCGGLEE